MDTPYKIGAVMAFVGNVNTSPSQVASTVCDTAFVPSTLLMGYKNPTKLHPLNDNCTGSSTSVANTSSTVLAVLLLKDRAQSSDNSGTGTSKRMANGNSTSVDINLGRV
ncbi:hypothetical protein OGATHE_000286 [Ogataea polymorpha]|uniref:Uncharacterized protein n=1 Tax=Ogataea polymorpha TaxID=460523 RepID=A0A9P8TH73_9ASCO|nr:hypothetical protein OGATHE_000286 [Ogataea polymorpha]